VRRSVITLLSILPRCERSVRGLYEPDLVGSFPDLGMNVTLPVLQLLGKYPRARQAVISSESTVAAATTTIQRDTSYMFYNIKFHH